MTSECTEDVRARLVAPLTAILTERDGVQGLLFFVEAHKLVLRDMVHVAIEGCGLAPPHVPPDVAPASTSWRNYYNKKQKMDLTWQRLRSHHWHETSRRARNLPGLFAKVGAVFHRLLSFQ